MRAVDVRPDPIRTVLLLGLLAGGLGLAFVSHAPNRIVAPRPLPLWEVVGVAPLTVLAVVVGVLAVTACRRGMMGHWLAGHWLAGAAAAVLLPVLLAVAGLAAAGLTAGGSPAARVSFGAGYWIATAATALLLLDALRRGRVGLAAMTAVAAVLAAAITVMAVAGWLDHLSIAREIATRRPEVAAALLRHGLLSGIAVAASLPIGAALGAIGWRCPRAGRPIFAVLGLLQTIPSLALFALLIEPLTWLSAAVPALSAAGISGIGVAPAVIALTLYGLLPMARAVETGLDAVPPGVLEAARGMGLSPGQVMLRVALPLALPAVLGGIRIVLVQVIGLAVVAALIGAGGLGTFVFQGLGQGANDLVLLGALAVIALALVADGLLRLARAGVVRRLA